MGVLILLLILDLPSLEFSYRECCFQEDSPSEEDQVGSAHVVPMQFSHVPVSLCAPQDIELGFKFQEDKHIVRMFSINKVENFNCKMWKDMFMGRMNQWRSTRLSSKIDYVREVASRTNIDDTIRKISPQGVPYEVPFWYRWPPHLPHIAEFEMQNLFSVALKL